MSQKTFRMLSAGAIQFALRKFCFWHITMYRKWWKRVQRCSGDEKVLTKAIAWQGKTTPLHVHQAFLYIPVPSLHDYHGKMPIFTFWEGRNAPINVNPVEGGVRASGGDLTNFKIFWSNSPGWETKGQSKVSKRTPPQGKKSKQTIL